MKTGADLPVVSPEDTMPSTLLVMSEKRLGLALVTDKEGKLLGIITDGDLRRKMDAGLLSRTAGEIMTPNPKTITRTRLAVEALQRMNAKSITSLCIADKAGKLVGLVHIHDLLRAGVS